MSAPAAPKIDTYRLEEIIRSVKGQADSDATQAADKARKATEERLVTELRGKYGGRTLYCYDEARQINRFATDPPREWNAVALSFEECIELMRPHIIRYHGESRWERIEAGLKLYREKKEEPSLEPEQTLVFEAEGYYYCFFCIAGDAFCDLVVERLAHEREEDKRRASRGCPGCIEVD